MAVFVDLESDNVAEPPQPHAAHTIHATRPNAGTDKNHGTGVSAAQCDAGRADVTVGRDGAPSSEEILSEAPEGEPGHAESTDGAEPPPRVRNAMTAAFGCYPVVMAIVSAIDLNTLDALARTCHGVHDGLVQFRSVVRGATLRCSNENLSVDPSETFRFRARAANWHYMEDGRSYNGKAGRCARDMVTECRRCGTVVCRNCAIKPPAPVVLRERHRRLCLACTKAPIGTLAKPPLEPATQLSSEAMQQAICQCNSAQGVWLCQPCGRSIRGADHDYQRIWHWRNQYGEVLGGLGTGIGEGDRGVICGREDACCAAKEREQETDCDAEDAKDSSTTPWANHVAVSTVLQGITISSSGSSTIDLHASGASSGSYGFASSSGSLSLSSSISSASGQRTPSPPLQLGPGYERHEIEGIGGVVKKKLVRMVRVGACVPEWQDEKTRNQILAREVQGRVRSWCGWCWRVIPGQKDLAAR